MTLLALALIFLGISCMFFCLWASQAAAFKAMREEHVTTRQHIERLSVRCATLSAQLDELVTLSKPTQSYQEQYHVQQDADIDGFLQAAQEELIQTLPKFNL